MSTYPDPIGTLLERQLLDVLDKVPPERLATFKKELGLYVVVVGSDGNNQLLINWATVRRQTDERAIVLKILDFLTKELSLQLITRRTFGTEEPRFEKPTADTVLHENGIRHDPALCQHCTVPPEVACPGSGLQSKQPGQDQCPWCVRVYDVTEDGKLPKHPR